MAYYKYYDSLDKAFCLSFYDKFLYERNYNDVLEFKKLETDDEWNSIDRLFLFILLIKIGKRKI